MSMTIRTSNGGFKYYYPNPLPSVTRLPNGDIALPDGSVLPFTASCPPDTWPGDSGQCEPWPGTDNVNWQCGGTLAPWGTNGCVPADTPPPSGIMPVVPAPAPRVVQIEQEETDRYTPWTHCHPVGQTLDEWAKSLPCSLAVGSARSAAMKDGGSGAGWFGCLLVGLALCGAAADVLGGRR